MDSESKGLGRQTGCGVVGQQNGTGMSPHTSKSAPLTGIEGERLEQSLRFWIRESLDGLALQVTLASAESAWPMSAYLFPDRIRHQDQRKIRQEIQRVQFVEMNERPCIDNDPRPGVNPCHAAPTRRPP